MLSVLVKALSFTFIIALGILLRKRGVGESAVEIIQILMLNVTLPAAIICSFASLEKLTPSMMILPLVGAVIAFSVMVLTMLVLRKSSRDDKISFCNIIPGTNIGNFCLPFVQSFFPAEGIVTLCLYDVGNSIFCLGGGYASISAYAGGSKDKFSIKKFLRTLLSSFPLDVYLVLFILAIIGIRPPQILANFVQPIADANAFIAMMMLGLSFHLELKKEYIRKIILLLGSRYGVATIISLLLWFFAPFNTITKEVIIMILFGPVNTVAGAYAAMCDGDSGLVSCVTSLSIPCSMIALTSLLFIFGLN